MAWGTWRLRHTPGNPVVLNPDDAYAPWAPENPSRAHNPLMNAEQSAVLDLLGERASGVALDAGCGSGRYMSLLAACGATPIGVDRSAAMLARAAEVSARLVRGDRRGLPLATASSDVAVCALALGAVAELDAAVSELARVLRPGGLVVWSVVHPLGATRGWTRSFGTAREHWAVANWWHSEVECVGACATAGLHVERELEPVVDGPPAALVMRARRME